MYNPDVLFLQNSEPCINKYITNNYNTITREDTHLIATKQPLYYIVSKEHCHYNLNGIMENEHGEDIALINYFSSVDNSNASYKSILNNVDNLSFIHNKIIGGGTLYNKNYEETINELCKKRHFKANDNSMITCPTFTKQQDFIIHNFKDIENNMFTTDLNFYSPHLLLYLNLSK